MVNMAEERPCGTSLCQWVASRHVIHIVREDIQGYVRNDLGDLAVAIADLARISDGGLGNPAPVDDDRLSELESSMLLSSAEGEARLASMSSGFIPSVVAIAVWADRQYGQEFACATARAICSRNLGSSRPCPRLRLNLRYPSRAAGECANVFMRFGVARNSVWTPSMSCLVLPMAWPGSLGVILVIS